MRAPLEVDLDDAGVLILHEHRLVAQALGHFLSQQSGLLFVGTVTDPLTAIAIAKAEAPDLVLLHIECTFGDGMRVDKRLWGMGIPSLVLASRGDARVAELGLGREQVLGCEEPLSHSLQRLDA